MGPDGDVSRHGAFSCRGVGAVLRLTGQEVLQVGLPSVFLPLYQCLGGCVCVCVGFQGGSCDQEIKCNFQERFMGL